MATEIVIAVYKPHAGKEAQLKDLVAEHDKALAASGLITDREPLLVQAKDGTWLEIFEWINVDAATEAHDHPVIGPLWEKMAEVCDFIPPADVPECSKPFPHFAPAYR